MSFGTFPVIGAYGRDYKNASAARSDWNAGRDFITAMGQYINNAQVQDGTRVSIRYNGKRQVFMFVQSKE